MKILIGQPKKEHEIEQLKNEIKINKGIDIVLYPEGYLTNEKTLEYACDLAKKYSKTIITGYLDTITPNPNSSVTNRAVIINQFGEKILDRAKTPINENLYSPSVIDYNGIKIGYLLCREILKGLDGFKNLNTCLNFISHPIGVGMFSDDQFEQWINEAKTIAKTYKTMIIGTSHADGSYRNCGVSLPISYCIDSNGESIFISKSDVRSRIVDLNTKEVVFA
ncbi:hypothetical protein [Oceanirhabdus seepicola]|uniref:CN hydrolase domain-containing protein n=1 Tax=Oceanirhabdus seepicola TaxID=2828781 RepID=A0A9J6P4T7_9CLOT|nr:hypothetical protein [Oceanirhabdus seepicola]MCM1991727.1 hypothetical protein [Oceanirhabdus seepicola]